MKNSGTGDIAKEDIPALSVRRKAGHTLFFVQI